MINSNFLKIISHILIIFLIFSSDSSYSQANIKKSKDETIQLSVNESEMKRNLDDSIYYELTQRFTVIGHEFEKDSTKSVLYLPYQIVKIYTKNGTVLTALKYVEGNGMFEHYVTSKSGEKIFHSREFLAYEAIPPNRNFAFNCFGQTFCDAQFWLNLNTGDAEQIIKDNKLISTEKVSDIKAGSKILLYNNSQLIHAILVNQNKELLSKDGTQSLKVYSNFDEFKIDTIYVFNKIRILN